MQVLHANSLESVNSSLSFRAAILLLAGFPFPGALEGRVTCRVPLAPGLRPLPNQLLGKSKTSKKKTTKKKKQPDHQHCPDAARLRWHLAGLPIEFSEH